nr:HesA/MoeB/ThiF family protein [Pedobacter sp. ASV19]
MLAKEEFQRYLKQILLDDIGLYGQNKLKEAKVAVIGAGGLGCPVLQYLCAAGIGHLGIIDFDVVEESNLHRQILYGQADIGLKKVQAAYKRLSEQNPNTIFTTHDHVVTEDNALQLLENYDFVVDGCDNFATRYAVNDACVSLGKPLVYGSILGYMGQLAGFNIEGSKNLRDLFPEPPNPEDVPSCSENGVLGTVPGIIGTIMAQMTIDVVLGRFEFRDQFILLHTRTLERTVLRIT